MAKEREREKEAGALSAGLISPMTVPPGQQGQTSGAQQAQQGWQAQYQSQYKGIYGYDSDYPVDKKIESARGSISVDVDPGSLGYGYAGKGELRRRRERSKRVVKGFVIVLMVVTVGVLGVWVRGGPYTGLPQGAGVGGERGGDAMVSTSSSSLLEGLGFNSSGVSVAGFGERCKVAWGTGWRSLMPGFVARYFSSPSTDRGLRDGMVGDEEGEIATQTVRLDRGLAWEMPGTMSRITRGRVAMTTRIEGNGNGDVTWSASTGDETILAQPRSVGVEGGQEQLESGRRTGRVVLEEEAEARRVRAARASAMWVKHAPVRPIHDVGHEGREEGRSSRGEL